MEYYRLNSPRLATVLELRKFRKLRKFVTTNTYFRSLSQCSKKNYTLKNSITGLIRNTFAIRALLKYIHLGENKTFYMNFDSKEDQISNVSFIALNIIGGITSLKGFLICYYEIIYV